MLDVGGKVSFSSIESSSEPWSRRCTLRRRLPLGSENLLTVNIFLCLWWYYLKICWLHFSEFWSDYFFIWVLTTSDIRQSNFLLLRINVDECDWLIFWIYTITLSKILCTVYSARIANKIILLKESQVNIYHGSWFSEPVRIRDWFCLFLKEILSSETIKYNIRERLYFIQLEYN